MEVSQSRSSKIGPPEEGPTRYITLAISNINLPPAYPLSSDRHNFSYSFNHVIPVNLHAFDCTEYYQTTILKNIQYFDIRRN